MKAKNIVLLFVTLVFTMDLSFAQTEKFEKFNFMIGKWVGSGVGFENGELSIESNFKLLIDSQQIEIRNESVYVPNDNYKNANNHIDSGFISYDENRELFVFKQFNSEDYASHYVLNDLLTEANMLVFETEEIENIARGGKARWTIKKLSENQIEMSFEGALTGKEYLCNGKIVLTRILKY